MLNGSLRYINVWMAWRSCLRTFFSLHVSHSSWNLRSHDYLCISHLYIQLFTFMCPQLVSHPIICGMLDTNLCWSAYQTIPLCRVWPREISLSRGYKLHTPTEVHSITVVSFVEYADALHVVARNLRELFIQVREIWFMGCGDFCIKVPWVTHEKELRKPYLELLMGKIYAKHATSYSWGGIRKMCFAWFLHNVQSSVYYEAETYQGRIYAKATNDMELTPSHCVVCSNDIQSQLQGN